MFYRIRELLLTWAGAVLLGVILHWGYRWAPCAATALISPICESVWEHIKLIYWPYLLAALWLNRGRPSGMKPWLAVQVLICGLMLGLGYIYHILLGGTAFWVDIVLYLTVMALGFWLPTRSSGPFRGPVWLLPVALSVGLGLLILLFTLWPPAGMLFRDMAAADAWLGRPC